MPLIRRIIDIGKTSRGVIFPKSWLAFLESKHGKVETVLIEVNGELVIRPILKRRRNGWAAHYNQVKERGG